MPGERFDSRNAGLTGGQGLAPVKGGQGTLGCGRLLPGLQSPTQGPLATWLPPRAQVTPLMLLSCAPSPAEPFTSPAPAPPRLDVLFAWTLCQLPAGLAPQTPSEGSQLLPEGLEVRLTSPSPLPRGTEPGLQDRLCQCHSYSCPAPGCSQPQAGAFALTPGLRLLSLNPCHRQVALPRPRRASVSSPAN